MLVSLGIAFFCFVLSKDFRAAIPLWKKFPALVPVLVLSTLPIISLAVHCGIQEDSIDLTLTYYWLIAILTFAASSQISIVPWMRAFLAGVFTVVCYAWLTSKGIISLGKSPAAFSNSILYSQFLATGIVLFAILYRFENFPHLKKVYLVGAAVFFWALASSQGRSGMLAVLVLLPLIFANIFNRTHRVKITAACVIALAVMLMSPMVQQRINGVVSDVENYKNNVTQTSIGYRFEMWRTAWDVYLAHPLSGAGPNGFRTAWNARDSGTDAPNQKFVEPHNAFLFYASSYGTIGLIALIWLYATLLWTGWARRHSLEGCVVFSFAVICILGSFTNTMFMGTVSRTWMMLFIGLQGSIFYASLKRKNTSSELRAAP